MGGRYDIALGRKFERRETIPDDSISDLPKTRSGDFRSGQVIKSETFNEIFERLEALEKKMG